MATPTRQFEGEFGTEAKCPHNKDGHKPNWDTVEINHDGNEIYLDVACKHCGRSGCLGTVAKVEGDILW